MPLGPLAGRAAARELLVQAAIEAANQRAHQLTKRAMYEHMRVHGFKPPTKSELNRAMKKAQRER